MESARDARCLTILLACADVVFVQSEAMQVCVEVAGAAVYWDRGAEPTDCYEMTVDEVSQCFTEWGNKNAETASVAVSPILYRCAVCARAHTRRRVCLRVWVRVPSYVFLRASDKMIFSRSRRMKKETCSTSRRLKMRAQITVSLLDSLNLYQSLTW